LLVCRVADKVRLVAIQAAMQGVTFTPEEVAILVAAFEGACLELGLKSRDDVMAEVVAKAIVNIGRREISDAQAVQNRALLLLRNGKNATAGP
jgi:hypothetical protein